MSVSDKKAKVEDKGVVNLKGASGKKGDDEFTDYTFKEGTTQVLKMQDIFTQEKGKDALKKMTEPETSAAPRVKGGAKGKKKAASKSAAKAAKGKKGEESTGEVRQSVDKILKYTPSKSAGKKEATPTKEKGKVSAKKSTTLGKKATPAMPSPSGKKSTKTTDQMTMAKFKQYLEWHEKKKKGGAAPAQGGKASQGGKVLGKRSAGKASTASGKSTSKGKRQAK